MWWLVAAAATVAPASGLTQAATRLSPWVVLKSAYRASTFAEFMQSVRREQGDAVLLDLRPVLPPTYLLMGKEANREVLSNLDPSLEQVLQELINLLPVSARVPSEVDERLQRRVASLFQSVSVVNGRLPYFKAQAERIRDRWAAQPASEPVPVFLELSDYVLRADLEVLFGARFCDAHGTRLLRLFDEWVRNIANGRLVGFFDELGVLLREAIADHLAQPELYEGERSVLGVYLADGALERHDDDALVGLLSMTLMAAVFNTQVSLAWILAHLYSDEALLARAREEAAACADMGNYESMEELTFLNSCIDEAVRLHTMLPGNTVLRKAKREVVLADGELRIPEGSLLWLYPNAVHQDEQYFPQPASFCPMRLLHGKSESMQSRFELVTFGHGQKRCIGEKMARATICTFLGTVLPALDADAPDELPADEFFDLIPASKLRLHNVRPAAKPLGAVEAPLSTSA